MIPYHARVAAFDDNPEHLRNIVNGLGRAGFWAMPFLFDAGKFEPELPKPFPGIRLVFSDIHLGPPLGSGGKVMFANAIIKGLKQVVVDGPYGLIFWSQFPGEAQSLWNEISDRAAESGLTPPVFWGTIDKNSVMKAGEAGLDPEFDSDNLRIQILKIVNDADAISLAMSWDERVGLAAMLATNRLYKLSTSAGDLAAWTKLLAYLAQEAVGKRRAEEYPVSALDNAMLPLLEDMIGNFSQGENEHHHTIGQSITKELKSAGANLSLPAGILAADLNTHYLIEESINKKFQMWERGMVTELGGGFSNSGEFVRNFDLAVDELIEAEFILPDQRHYREKVQKLLREAKLHIVELSAECDQVQCKIATHRYLLALWLPASCFEVCAKWDKKNKRFRNEFANASIINIGEMKLKNQNESHYLLVSTRRFMILPPGKKIDGKCAFRLRRTVIDELAHHYATYSRRPGVMRFV